MFYYAVEVFYIMHISNNVCLSLLTPLCSCLFNSLQTSFIPIKISKKVVYNRWIPHSSKVNSVKSSKANSKENPD